VWNAAVSEKPELGKETPSPDFYPLRLNPPALKKKDSSEVMASYSHSDSPTPSIWRPAVPNVAGAF